jgi:ribonuclease BN (tRNA processing enzyme)
LAEPYKEEKRKNKMTIYGPKGTKARVNHILAAIGMLGRKPKHEISIKEIGDGHSVALGCCTVTGYHVVHSHQGACLAYRIESNKKVICYSGDTSYCPGLKKACMNADLAIIEASFPAKFNFEGHMTTEKTASLAKLTNVKKLVLTHISSNYLKKYNMLKEAKKFYEGPLMIAKDMMRIKI